MYRHDPMIRLCNHISKSCIDRGKIPCRILIIGNDLLNLFFERPGVHHAFFRLLRFGRHLLWRTLLGCTALRFISWNGDRCAFFCRFLSQIALCYRADHRKHGSCRCSAAAKITHPARNRICLRVRGCFTTFSRINERFCLGSSSGFFLSSIHDLLSKTLSPL